jgi:cardiolipin synthase C
MNFDPRSININTEMGVMINSPELGIDLEQMITRLMQPQNSWQVLLDDDGDLYWRSSKGIENSQPAQNFWQRMQDVFFMMFPKDYTDSYEQVFITSNNQSFKLSLILPPERLISRIYR